MNKWFTRMGLAMAFFAGTNTVQAQETLAIDGSKGYDFMAGSGLVKGQDYILPGTDETWYAMPDFFTHKEGNVWTFQAYGMPEYAYFIVADEDLKYIKVEHHATDEVGSAYANWSENKALWLNGGGIGFPSVAVADINWTAPGYSGESECVPQIEENVYRLTLVMGEQQSTSRVNFKFYYGNNWGGDVTSVTEGGILTMDENPYLYLNGQAEPVTSDHGNIFNVSGAEFADGDTLILTIDMNQNGRVMVDYRERVVTNFPTFNGTDMAHRGSYFVYEGTLTQGQEFTIGNEEAADGMTLADAYVDEYFATNLGGGKFQFNAISGDYTVLLVPALNYVKIFPGTYDAPGTFADNKAIWLIGNSVGKPTYGTNSSSWGATLASSIPVAQVAENVYKIGFTIGDDLSSSVNIKFYGQYGWGQEFRCQDLDMEANDYLNLIQGVRTVNINYDDDGNENITVDWGNENGNIKNGTASLAKGDKLVLTIDLNGYVPATYDAEDALNPLAELDPGVKGKISVEYQAYAGPTLTLNGADMTATETGYKITTDFVQGNTYVVAGELADDLAKIKADDFFYNYDYFTKVGDGQYKFNAVSGRYTLDADLSKSYFRIYPVQADGSAGIFTEEGGWATWVCGNDGIGFPSYATNVNNWGAANNWAQTLGISISPAQVANKIYRLTVTVGKQITGNAVFKFYDSYNYTITDGRASDKAEDFIDLLDENIVYSGNDLAFNNLEDGATYVVIIDRTGERSTIKAEKATDETGAGVDLPTGIKGVTVIGENTNAAIYNLQGVRVATPTKGLYIQNGKKYIVK